MMLIEGGLIPSLIPNCQFEAGHLLERGVY